MKRSFNTACRMTGIEDLHKHDLRHAFVTRSILAGVPPAVVLKASGHSSDEWKRYLNVTPDMLHDLFTPLEGQESEAVKNYGYEVARSNSRAPCSMRRPCCSKCWNHCPGGRPSSHG